MTVHNFYLLIQRYTRSFINSFGVPCVIMDEGANRLKFITQKFREIHPASGVSTRPRHEISLNSAVTTVTRMDVYIHR